MVTTALTDTARTSPVDKDLSVKAEINLYYDLYTPDAHPDLHPLLIGVHGYGAHKGYMMREARSVVPEGWAIASIQAPHPHFRPTPDGYRVGYGWLTDVRPEEHIALHHRFILDVIDKLVESAQVDPGRVVLYGFSQASALNFRFALTYPERLAGIVSVCGGIPSDWDSNDAYGRFSGQVLYLYGDDDEFYTGEQFSDYDRKLAARMNRYHSRQFHAKHEITDEMRAEIRSWLKSI